MSDSSGDDISFTPSQLRKYLDSRRHPQRNIKLKTEATVVPDGLGLRSHQNHGGLGRWRSNTAKPTIGSSRQGGLSAFSSGTEQRTSPKPRGSGLLTAWDRNAARNSSSDDDDDERLRSRASALAHALRQRRSGVAPALQQGLSWRQREASPAINTAEQKPLNISPGLGRGTLSATNTDAPQSGARDRHTSPTAASFYLGTSEERFGAAPRSPAATAPLSLQQALSTPTSPARSRVLEQEPSSPYGSRATGNAQGSQLSPQSARPSTAPRLRAYADAPEAYMGASPSSPLRTMRPDRNATGFYNDEPYSSTHGTGLGTLKALSASVPDASAGRSPGAAAAAFPQAYGSGNSNLLGLVVGNPLPDTYTGSSAVRSTRSPPMSPKAALDDGRYTSPGRGGLGLLGATDAYTPGVTSFSFPVQDQQPAAGLSRQASRLDARDAATSPRQPGDYGSARHESPSRVPIERSDREASPTGSFGGLSRVRPISSITEELDNLMRNVTAMGGGRGGPSRSGSPLRGPAGGLAQSPSPRGRDTGGTPSSPLASRSALGSPRRPDAGSGGIQSVLSQLATIKRDMDQLRDNVLKERGADGTAALTASSPGAGLAALTLATGGPPSPRRLSWSNPGSPTFTDISSLSLSRKTPRRGRSPSQRYIASSASPTSPPRQSGPAQGGIPLPPMQSATAQMHTPFADLRSLGPDLLPPQQQQRRLVQEPEHIDGILAELRSIRHDLSALGDPATGGLESAASGLSRRSRSASPHFSQPSPGPSSGHRGNRRDSSSGGEGGREESSRMRPRASSPRAGRYQPDRVEEEQRRDTDAAWRRLVAAVDPVGLRSSAASPAQQQAARAAEQSPSRRSRDAAAGPYGRSSPNSPLISPLRASTVLRSTPGAAQKTSAGTPAPAATQKKAGGSAEAQSASRDGQRGGAGGMTALMLGSMPDGRVRIQEDPGPEPAPPVPLSSSSLALFSSQKQRALDDLMHGFGQTMKTSISAEPPSTDGAAGGSEREPASRARAASPITTRTLQADMPLAAAAALQGSGDRTRPAAAGRSPSSRQRGPAAEAAAEARGDPWVSSVLGDSRGNAGRSRGSRYAPPMRDLDVEGSHQADLARIMSAGVRTSQRRTEDAAPGLPQPAGGRQTSTPSAAAERPQIGRMQSQSSGQRDPESLASLSLNSNPAIPVGGISKSLEQALNRLLPARATADGARGTNAGDSSSPSGPGGQSSGSRRAQLNAESLSRLRGSVSEVWSFGGAPQSPVPRRKLDTSVGGAPGASTSSVGKGSDRRSIAPLNPADLLPFTADHTVHRYRAPSSDSQSLALEQLRRQGGSPAASPRGRTMERGRTTDSAGAQEEAQAGNRKAPAPGGMVGEEGLGGRGARAASVASSAAGGGFSRSNSNLRSSCLHPEDDVLGSRSGGSVDFSRQDIGSWPNDVADVVDRRVDSGDSGSEEYGREERSQRRRSQHAGQGTTTGSDWSRKLSEALGSSPPASAASFGASPERRAALEALLSIKPLRSRAHSDLPPSPSRSMSPAVRAATAALRQMSVEVPPAGLGSPRYAPTEDGTLRSPPRPSSPFGVQSRTPSSQDPGSTPLSTRTSTAGQNALPRSAAASQGPAAGDEGGVCSDDMEGEEATVSLASGQGSPRRSPSFSSPADSGGEGTLERFLRSFERPGAGKKSPASGAESPRSPPGAAAALPSGRDAGNNTSPRSAGTPKRPPQLQIDLDATSQRSRQSKTGSLPSPAASPAASPRGAVRLLDPAGLRPAGGVTSSPRQAAAAAATPTSPRSPMSGAAAAATAAPAAGSATAAAGSVASPVPEDLVAEALAEVERDAAYLAAVVGPLSVASSMEQERLAQWLDDPRQLAGRPRLATVSEGMEAPDGSNEASLPALLAAGGYGLSGRGQAPAQQSQSPDESAGRPVRLLDRLEALSPQAGEVDEGYLAAMLGPLSVDPSMEQERLAQWLDSPPGAAAGQRASGRWQPRLGGVEEGGQELLLPGGGAGKPLSGRAGEGSAGGSRPLAGSRDWPPGLEPYRDVGPEFDRSSKSPQSPLAAGTAAAAAAGGVLSGLLSTESSQERLAQWLDTPGSGQAAAVSPGEQQQQQSAGDSIYQLSGEDGLAFGQQAGASPGWAGGYMAAQPALGGPSPQSSSRSHHASPRGASPQRPAPAAAWLAGQSRATASMSAPSRYATSLESPESSDWTVPQQVYGAADGGAPEVSPGGAEGGPEDAGWEEEDPAAATAARTTGAVAGAAPGGVAVASSGESAHVLPLYMPPNPEAGDAAAAAPPQPANAPRRQYRAGRPEVSIGGVSLRVLGDGAGAQQVPAAAAPGQTHPTSATAAARQQQQQQQQQQALPRGSRVPRPTPHQHPLPTMPAHAMRVAVPAGLQPVSPWAVYGSPAFVGPMPGYGAVVLAPVEQGRRMVLAAPRLSSTLIGPSAAEGAGRPVGAAAAAAVVQGEQPEEQRAQTAVQRQALSTLLTSLQHINSATQATCARMLEQYYG